MNSADQKKAKTARRMRGSVFASGHQAFTRGILNDSRVVVISKGSSFYNSNNFCLLGFLHAIPDYFQQNGKVTKWTRQDVVAVNRLMRTKLPNDNKIVIASTPVWVDEHYMNLLDGGIIHEAAHSLYTTIGTSVDIDRMLDILTRHYDPDVEIETKIGLIQKLWNIFEDAYIERHINAKFLGALPKLQIVHEYVWDLEKPGRQLQPGEVASTEDGRMIKGMDPIDHFSCYLRDRVEHYLSGAPLNEYMPQVTDVVDRLFADEVHDSDFTEDTYDTLELALRTITKLNDIFDQAEQQSQQGQGQGQSQEGQEGQQSQQSQSGQSSQGQEGEEGQSQGQKGQDSKPDSSNSKSGNDTSQNGSTPEWQEYGSDSDSEESSQGDSEGDEAGDEGTGSGEDSDGDSEGSQDGQDDGQGSGEEDGDEEQGSSGGQGEDESDAEEEGQGSGDGDSDEEGDDGENAEGSSGQDGNEGDDSEEDGSEGSDSKGDGQRDDGDEEEAETQQDDPGQGNMPSKPPKWDNEVLDALSKAREAENVKDHTDALQDAYDDATTEDAPSTVHPYTRDQDEIVEIQPTMTEYEDRIYNEMIDECRQATVALRPRMLSFFRGQKKTRRVHRQESGRRLGRTVSEVIYRDKPRPFQKKTQRNMRNSVVSLVLDESGSMRSYEYQARMILASLALTIGELRIPHEVIGFTSSNKSAVQLDPNDDWYEVQKQFTRIHPLRFRIFRKFDDPFNVNSYRKLTHTDASGLTPLPDAIEFAGSRLVSRKEEQKIMFVVTDGQPCYQEMNWSHGDYMRMMQSQVDSYKKMGVEVLFVGVGYDASYVQQFENSVFIRGSENFGAVFAQFLMEQMQRLLHG